MVEIKVIKKSGFRQPIDILKVKLALQKTAKSINEEFKESDWKEFKPRILARLEPIMEGREEIFFWEIDDAVIDSLLRSRFKEIAREYISSRSRVRQDKLNDLSLSPVAMQLLKERYLKKDNSNNPIETAKEMMIRISTAVANVEKTSELRQLYTTKFIGMLCNLDFLPNSPCLVSAGTNRKGTWLACFASKIDDSLDDIFDKVKVGAKIFQMGGGFGISISNLRETGARIKTSNGISSGPIAFMKLFNTMVEVVKAGGFRRGALMTIMDYDKPDIIRFIHCKEDVKELNNMNISVLIKNKFFDNLKTNEDISLISPFTNKQVGVISPSLLLEDIATNIWKTGEPGVLFYDRMNSDNPTPHLGDISVTNPCLGKNEVILTSTGYKPMGELNGQEIQIIGSDGIQHSSKIVYSGKKKTILLKLSNKKIITCTDNHIWIDSNNVETEARNLKHKKIKPYLDLTYEFDDLYMKFGFIQGDGQLSRLNSKHHKCIEINIGKKDDDILNLFNLDRIVDGNKVYSYYVNGFNDKCNNLGFSKNTLPTRELPTSFNNWMMKERLSFLRGLYSANGCVIKNYRVAIKSTCKSLLDEIQLELNGIGIESYITVNKPKNVKFDNGIYLCKQSYDLNIHKFESLVRFHDYIGFIQKYKQDNLIQLIDKKNPSVINIYDGEEEDVYDFMMNEHHFGIVDGFISHNCSESALLSGEACDLGSINLTKHIKDGDIDWDKLAETTKLGIRFLDNMLDGSPYPTKEIEEAVKKTRKVGLGIMGFADILIILGIKYSSSDAIKMAGKIMSFINDVASEYSTELGKEKGVYPAYKDGYHKRRNSIVTTVAPTGSLSLICGISSGIEPNFSREYTRILDGNTIKISHPLKDNKDFETTYDISPEQHLMILAEFQKHVENSISKTINCPESTTVADIKNLIIKAHIMDCKGVAIFRNNCNREAMIKCEECVIK